MSNLKQPMDWSAFTNKVLGTLGRCFLLPLVVFGGLLAFKGDASTGVDVLFGASCVFLLAALGLAVFKPLLIKKYPEDSREKYIVDPHIPHEQLSPLQKIAVAYCDGNLIDACSYMLENLDLQTQREYTAELTQEEAEACMVAFDRLITRTHTEKAVEEIVDQEHRLTALKMTQEQLLAADKNPYVAKMWKWVGILAVTCVAVVLTATFGGRLFRNNSLAESIATLLACAATFFAYRVADLLISFIHFRHAKRSLQKQQERE